MRGHRRRSRIGPAIAKPTTAPKRRRRAFTLVELLVVLAILSLLVAVILPSLTSARDLARLAVCAAMMRDVHSGLMMYAAASQQRMPPFAFSDYHGDLPLSGHWGGAGQAGGHGSLGRRGVECVNLWPLVDGGLVPASQLICPGAPGELQSGRASMFGYTARCSTYCLRFPTSADLFDSSPGLAYFGDGTLLGIYAQAAGGQRIRVGMYYQTVPLVRIDERYRIEVSAACGDGVYDAAEGVLLSDAFWRQDHAAAAPDGSLGQTYPVRIRWCHGDRFNTLDGGGAVRTVSDDGTVRANSIPPGGSLGDDGRHWAGYAERIWRFFDESR